MIRLDLLLFGYVVVCVDLKDMARVSDYLLKAGINVKISAGGKFFVRRSDVERVKTLLNEINCNIAPIRGLYGFMLRIRKRYGLILAGLLTLFMMIFSSGIVWDVRVEGCAPEQEAEILDELKEAGLCVGQSWYDLDKSALESKTLSTSDRVAWLSINRRGAVAYVKVVPKTVQKPPEIKTGYANIVAVEDCVIEQINVKEGIALVKIGESVRKGQILISGVIPTALGGGYCYADGEVIGRRADRIEVIVSETVSEKNYASNSKDDVSVDFFGFSINIFKIYGNSDSMCDIIEEKIALSLAGKRLPLGYTVATYREYTITERKRSADEMTAVAAESLRLLLLDRLANADLVAIRTDGAFENGSYTMYSELIVRESVTEIQEFNVDLEK